MAQRWEYARVTYVYHLKAKQLVVTQLGERLLESRPLLDDYVASLGQDGWELVTVVESSQVLWFKRPLAGQG